jgi:SPP1 gp7 family putative phage head morphogenesis protein
MALPAVVETERAWRAALAAREEAAMQAMAVRYAEFTERMMAEFEALAEQVTRMAAEGEVVSIGKVYQLERYQRMAAQMDRAYAEFRPYAAEVISAEQRYLLDAGMDNARGELRAIGESSVIADTFATMVEGWPAGAIDQMVGQTQGGPLAELLAGATTDAEADVGRSLVEGVALGKNPSVVAREMADRFGLPLARANCIARTEMLSAFRSSTLEGYRQAGVEQYQRLSAQDSVVCEGCAAAEGGLYWTNEDFEDHPNCRCSCIPYYPGAVQFPMGEDWFNTLDEGDQRQILGPTKFDMWKNGEVKFDQFATRTGNATWGGAIGPTSVRDLRAGGGGLPQLRAPTTPPALPGGVMGSQVASGLPLPGGGITDAEM